MNDSPQYPPKSDKPQGGNSLADENLLHRLGARVRRERQRRGWTLAELSSRSGLSPRFLTRVEAGDGNISVLRLDRLARALGRPIDRLLAAAPRTRPVIALTGMRGAGKSTVGPQLAKQLGVPYFEMDDRIAETAGLPQAQIFELHGADYYRKLEREVLTDLLDDDRPLVLATPGGIVENQGTWELLLERASVVWLKARPEDHWTRVLGQGDHRPMRDRPDARATMRTLLQSRERRYREAPVVEDTHDREPHEIAASLYRRVIASART
jgi:XRE family aerobic/anaerobic benzoate catabolism transcriptional regulator